MKNCEPFVFGPAFAIASVALDDLVVVELVLELVAGAAGAVPARAAALDHEVGDHAVEDEPVVEAVAGELREVRDGLRRVVGEELDLDRALAGGHGCGHGRDASRRPALTHPTADASLQFADGDEANLSLPAGRASQELARSWRRLTRVATVVAVMTAPALFVWFTQQNGWGWCRRCSPRSRS